MPHSRSAHLWSGPSNPNCKGKQASNLYARANELDARLSNESGGDGVEQADQSPYSRDERCVCDFDVVVDTIQFYVDCYHRDEAP
jgi:hypothetical protein